MSLSSPSETSPCFLPQRQNVNKIKNMIATPVQLFGTQLKKADIVAESFQKYFKRNTNIDLSARRLKIFTPPPVSNNLWISLVE